MSYKARLLFVVSLLPLVYSANAFAYVGPGSGLSAIGAFLALVGAILLAVLGFFWYPIKRLFNRRRLANGPHDTALHDTAPHDGELNTSDEPELIQGSADRVQRQADKTGEKPDT